MKQKQNPNEKKSRNSDVLPLTYFLLLSPSPATLCGLHFMREHTRYGVFAGKFSFWSNAVRRHGKHQLREHYAATCVRVAVVDCWLSNVECTENVNNE